MCERVWHQGDRTTHLQEWERPCDNPPIDVKLAFDDGRERSRPSVGLLFPHIFVSNWISSFTWFLNKPESKKDHRRTPKKIIEHSYSMPLRVEMFLLGSWRLKGSSVNKSRSNSNQIPRQIPFPAVVVWRESRNLRSRGTSPNQSVSSITIISATLLLSSLSCHLLLCIWFSGTRSICKTVQLYVVGG